MRTATIPLEEYEELKRKENDINVWKEKYLNLKDNLIIKDQIELQPYGADILFYLDVDMIRNLLEIEENKITINGESRSKFIVRKRGLSNE